MRASLSLKLVSVIVLLGGIAAGISAFALYEAAERQHWSERTEAVWNAGLQASGLARAIEHTVVQATALYTAADTEEARGRLAALQGALAEVERLRGPFLAAMEGHLPAAEERRLDLAVKEFVAYQTDTAELGLTVSPKAALIQGTDEATVANRERMVARINDLGRTVLATLDAQRQATAEARDRATLALIAGPALAIGLGLVAALWIVITQIREPLNRLRQAMQDLAAGRLDGVVPFTSRRDEVGAMARTIAAFQAALIEKDRLDLSARARVDEDAARAERLAEATQAFEQETGAAVAELAGSAEAMRAAADSLTGTAEDMAGRAGIVSGASGQSAELVNGVAGAAEELSSSARAIAEQVERARTISDVALSDTSSLEETVQALARAAAEIGTVSSLIRSVADQTSLLALNATIESARAGAAGRGFAVVAAEVKALAGQTALATDRIVAQVEAIETASGGTAAAIGSIRSTVVQLGLIASEVSGAAEQQGQASQEIASAIARAAMEVRTVSDSVADMRGAAASNAERAGEVRSGAVRVSDGAASLEAAVTTFLLRVHAAEA